MTSQPIQQMGGGQITHHAAAHTAHLPQIVIQQEQNIVNLNIFARLIYNCDAVGIAICGHADIIPTFFNAVNQHAQGLKIRGWGTPRQRGGRAARECW